MASETGAGTGALVRMRCRSIVLLCAHNDELRQGERGRRVLERVSYLLFVMWVMGNLCMPGGRGEKNVV